MIFQAGSEIVTHKPGVDDKSYIEVDGEDNNERTPRQKNDKQTTTIISEEPYETPVILRTKPWAPSVAQVDDTDAEDSEFERVVITRRKKATRVRQLERC